jgi:hypothetical protein
MLPEPEVPFVEGEPPLFLRASEIIHSKRDTLQYRVLLHILEVHNFSPPRDSDDDAPPPSSDSRDSGGDGIPGSMHSSLQPWLRMFRLAGAVDDRGRLLPSLPQHDSRASWPTSVPSSSLCMSRFVIEAAVTVRTVQRAEGSTPKKNNHPTKQRRLRATWE